VARFSVTGAVTVAEYPQAIEGFEAELIVKAVLL
jgi:hypothetical protein